MTFVIIFYLTSKCTFFFIQLVHSFILGPFGIVAHCRFGYFLLFPAGLNFVARTELEYFPTTFDPLKQEIQILAIVLILIKIYYHKYNRFANI